MDSTDIVKRLGRWIILIGSVTSSHQIFQMHVYMLGVYDANTHSSSPISSQYLFNHAKALVSDLCLKRKLTNVVELHANKACYYH